MIPILVMTALLGAVAPTPAASASAVKHYVFGLRASTSWVVRQAGLSLGVYRSGSMGDLAFGAPASAPVSIRLATAPSRASIN